LGMANNAIVKFKIQVVWFIFFNDDGALGQ
jgi:hypothetical protein